MGETQPRLRIKDLPAGERPYDKMEKFGVDSLSSAELLAIIIKTGNKGETSVDIARRLLAQDQGREGLAFLYDLSLEQLQTVKGIGRVKAIQIKAVIELSRRIASTYNAGNRVVIKSPADASGLFMEELRHLKVEVFKVVLLNTKNHVIKHLNISMGSLNASIVHPREVFAEAVKSGSASVLLVHNHPSGDPEPSAEDVRTTRRLVDAGEILGIKVLDHIIMGDGKFTSLSDRGLI